MYVIKYKNMLRISELTTPLKKLIAKATVTPYLRFPFLIILSWILCLSFYCLTVEVIIYVYIAKQCILYIHVCI